MNSDVAWHYLPCSMICEEREHRWSESSTFGIWIDMGTLFLDLDFVCTLFTYSPRSRNQDWHETWCVSLMSSVPLCAQGDDGTGNHCQGPAVGMGLTSFCGNLDSSPSEDRLELQGICLFFTSYFLPSSPLFTAPLLLFFKYQKDQRGRPLECRVHMEVMGYYPNSFSSPPKIPFYLLR